MNCNVFVTVHAYNNFQCPFQNNYNLLFSDKKYALQRERSKKANFFLIKHARAFVMCAYG
jgi:hypothetical protein